MAAPVIPILLTKEDIQEYKTLTNNIDESERLFPHIREAQKFDLQPLLGKQLYFDFIKNVADANYQDLLNGVEYQDEDDVTVMFEGVKPVLVYYAYARLIQRYASDVTRYGVVKKFTEESEHATQKEVQELVNNARSGAIAYHPDLFDYLDKHKDDFPLWKGRGGSEKKALRTTINIGAVGRKNNNDFIDTEIKRGRCGSCGNPYTYCKCQ